MRGVEGDILFEGGDYFKYFHQRGAINPGAASAGPVLCIMNQSRTQSLQAFWSAGQRGGIEKIQFF